ncbi:erythromycin esterase family protein [Streptomyces sp. NPDC058794]|uniref:erythromycin esterase family protein n=1 Tax=Streptomyces sp. NPDC058794 TaxID=3346636 RepID=UPI0036761052
MSAPAEAAAVPDEHRLIRQDAISLTSLQSLDPLLDRIGDAHYVLLGEASHGTSEYYRWRSVLTRRLIEEKGFSFVAVEGDWPDCLSVHCSVTGAPGAPDDPRDVLEGFTRWPRWMWANTEVADFTRWLRQHNDRLPPGSRAGFFGLDVYSLWNSLHAVLDHLRTHRPEHVETALEAYHCLEPYAEDPQEYARSTRMIPSGCEPEVLALLVELRRAAKRAHAPGRLAEFAVRQNAEVLAGAEAYYRAMVRGGPESWNIRDCHMADTLDRLMDHHGPDAKAVVWEHNTHVGDARATDMADAGMVNVGQLIRERHGADEVVLVGFGSYEGTVMAADSWGARPRVHRVPPARSGSLEERLHQALAGQQVLFLLTSDGRPAADGDAALRWFDDELDHRAIGVVYRPTHERWVNYVPTRLAARYDAFCYLDRTTALTPLQGDQRDTAEEETWPSGV